jgi:hypothetical protein
LILDPFDYLPYATRGGEEHFVWHMAGAPRVFKLTKANCFGFTVDAEWFLDEESDAAELKPALRGATPLEYFERLLLQNEIFGDAVEFVGIIDKRQALQVVTSQPAIRGEPATPSEIAALMEALSFSPLPQVNLGRAGALSFLAPANELRLSTATRPTSFRRAATLCPST